MAGLDSLLTPLVCLLFVRRVVGGTRVRGAVPEPVRYRFVLEILARAQCKGGGKKLSENRAFCSTMFVTLRS